MRLKFDMGITLGILSGIFSILNLTISVSILYSLRYNVFAVIFNIGFLQIFLIALSIGIILGIIISKIFVKFYKILPSENSIIKGMILMLPFFVGSIVFVVSYPFDLFFSIPFVIILHGVFLGILWNYLSKNNEKKLSYENTRSSNIKTKLNDNKETKKEELTFLFRQLQDKNVQLDLGKINHYLEMNNQRFLEKAELILNHLKHKYERYESYESDLNMVKQKIKELTNRFASGEITSEGYSKALHNLESEKKEIEEKMWTLRSELFKDEYEKPF